MIHFEVTQSADKNVLGPFKYFTNQVYLGRKLGDLLIDDPGLLNSHLMIEVVEKDLLVHPQKDVSFYLLNGKRSSSIRKLKTGDTIGIGNSEIKMLGYEQTETKTKKMVLEEKLTRLVEENSPRLEVLEKISQLMKS